jgi:hypothetical protein
MKNIFESPEVMAAYAQIDCCYFLIEEAAKRFDKPRTGIELMIDKATGYDKAIEKKFQEYIIELLEQIIDCKKKIEADYSGDEKFLDELKNLKTITP